MSPLTILILISFQNIAYTIQVKFTKHGGKMFVETDSKHYAMYGQVTDMFGVRVVVVSDNNHYFQTSNCEKKWQDLDSINQEHLKGYKKIREEYSKFKDESPSISGIPTDSYTWSNTFSKEEREYSEERLDDNTLVFSSKYFPGNLAKLISSGNIVIFVYYDGRVVLKTLDCLYLNEKILIRGINRSLINRSKLSLFSSTGDNALRKYLEKSGINEEKFELEQKFIKTYTSKELAAMQRAVMSEGSRFLNGY